MKDITSDIKNKKTRNLFCFVSCCFVVIFCFATMFGDDISSMRVEGGSLLAYWNKALELYTTWSSRVLVNFVLYFFTDHNPMLWALYMGICVFVLMYAFSVLFTNKNNKMASAVIVALITSYTFKDISTAGWIATTTTYFGPTAFGFFSLIPIKKAWLNERLKWYEYIIYAVSLIYAANNEQVMVVILGAYVTAFIYFLFNRKSQVFIILQLILSIASCLFVMTCPGNMVRKGVEIRWFPTYGMLNKIDKIDLGYATTMKWLFFENNPYVLYVLILFVFLIWKKYKSATLRIMSTVPALLMLFTGPLKTVSEYLFPNLIELTNDISTYGLVTTENRGGPVQLGVYIVWAALIIIICIEIVLLSERLSSLLACIVLICTGTASRLIMGFSPTIYASKYRTCEVMAFCIIAVGCLIYGQYANSYILTDKEKKAVSYASYGLLLFNLINLFFLVATTNVNTI